MKIVPPANSAAQAFEIPLGFDAGSVNPPRPGFRGRLLLEVTRWNA